MLKPILVVMAAGMGSRYGGLKQIDPIGPSGEIIIDYSIYDAIKAGFGKVVFIIKKETEEIFREAIGKRIEKVVDTEYAFQKLEDLPQGFTLPEGRVKPWGTGQAVMSCKHLVDRPFAVLNADDYYGPAAFQSMSAFLRETDEKSALQQYCMIGYWLKNTLSDNGHVARGVCDVDGDGYLKEIKERTKIIKSGASACYTEDDMTWIDLPKDSIVSMNFWGFTPQIFAELEAGFPEFLRNNRDNILKAEYFLPLVVDRLIRENKASFKVLSSSDKWYGVTYKEDKPQVQQALLEMIREGRYGMNLWGIGG